MRCASASRALRALCELPALRALGALRAPRAPRAMRALRAMRAPCAPRVSAFVSPLNVRARTDAACVSTRDYRQINRETRTQADLALRIERIARSGRVIRIAKSAQISRSCRAKCVGVRRSV